MRVKTIDRYGRFRAVSFNSGRMLINSVVMNIKFTLDLLGTTDDVKVPIKLFNVTLSRTQTEFMPPPLFTHTKFSTIVQCKTLPARYRRCFCCMRILTA
jgi:hypothetical protein